MSSIEDITLKEVIAVEAEISRLRSTSNNWQDYLSFLRYIPYTGKTTSAQEFRLRRDSYMDKLLGQLKKEIQEGVEISCIAGNILKDPEAKLNEGLLTLYAH
jgi:phenylacetate 2-hydroxylase